MNYEGYLQGLLGVEFPGGPKIEDLAEKGNPKRYELPNLIALIFVVQNALGGGVNSSLRLDRHGKTLSSYLLYHLILNVSLDMMPNNSPYREKFK